MPIVRFQGREIDVPSGTRLRKALLDAGLSPHNGEARWFNCKGLGSCGTCAVRVQAVEGPVHDRSRMERWRLDFHPHRRSSGLRLACQLRVEGDLEVTKYPGFWGQLTPDRHDD